MRVKFVRSIPRPSDEDVIRCLVTLVVDGIQTKQGQTQQFTNWLHFEVVINASELKNSHRNKTV
jgi:hypothetical protein